MNTPPGIVATVPADDDTGVPTNAVLDVTWSEPIDCSTVVPGVVVMQLDDATQLALTVDCNYDAGNGTMTFHIDPDVDLPEDTHVSVGVVGSGTILDLEGGAMAADFIWDFTTGVADATPPTVLTRNPDAGAVGVAINTSINVSFSEPVACASVAAAAALSSASTPIAFTLSCNAESVTLDPDADLPSNATIDVSFAGSVADLAGNTLGSAVAWSFTTAAAADTTPPAAPVATNAPASTLLQQVVVNGTKDAAEATNVEARQLVDGVAQGGFVEIVPTDALSTWQATFALAVGVNTFELRSRDAAQNVSTAPSSFVVTRDPSPVADPVVTLITSPTDAPQQVIEGTKPAATGIVINGVLVVPTGDASTTWDAEVTLNPGANILTIKARDPGGQESADVVETIDYNQPAPLTQGEVKVEMDIISVWEQQGDESVAVVSARAGNAIATDLNHFGASVWVEGPLPELAPGVPERCYYDDAAFERKYTRYVATIANTTYDRDPRATGNGCNLNSKAPLNCNGFQWEPEYAGPNFVAALVESGRWASTPGAPLNDTTDRRDSAGHSKSSATGAFAFSATALMFTNAQNGLQPRLLHPNAAVVDGVTMASINPQHWSAVSPLLACAPACGDDQHCVDTNGTFEAPSGGAVECRDPLPGGFSTCTSDAQCGEWLRCSANPKSACGNQRCCEDSYAQNVPLCKDGTVSVDDGTGTPVCRGESIKDWRERLSVRWNLRNAAGNFVRPGWYAIHVELAYDAVNPGRSLPAWNSRFLVLDTETCWDDPSHDTLGQHRAVALVHVDGQNGSVVFADEKAFDKPVPACSIGGGDRIKCSCGGGDSWPCPETPNSNTGTGQKVHFLDPDFRGGAGALRVEYCATGACP